MTALFACVLALAAPQASTPQVPTTQRVDLAQIGLSFDAPKEWEVTYDRRSRDYSIVVPVPDSSDAKARLVISPVNFRAEKDVWQLSQATFHKNAKREIVRQWEEELLGVPLLLTKVNWNVRSVAQTEVVGLHYADSPRKMMFRLTAAAEDFDKVNFVWRNALLSLRTFDGKAPQANDPNRPFDPKVKPELPTRPPVRNTVDSVNRPATNASLTKGDGSFDLEVARRAVVLRYPTAWKVEANNGVLTLTHPNVANPVRVTVSSTLDSDPAPRALFRQASQTLADYTKVERRDEILPRPNAAAATLASVWRRGPSANGTLFTLDATVANGEFYLLAGFRSSNPATIGAERRLVEELLEQLTLELKS